MTALVIIIFNFGGESGKQQFQYGKVEVQEEFQGVEFGGEIHAVKNDTLHLNEQLIIKGEKGYLISTSTRILSTFLKIMSESMI